jgi:hypothetical protein
MYGWGGGQSQNFLLYRYPTSLLPCSTPQARHLRVFIERKQEDTIHGCGEVANEMVPSPHPGGQRTGWHLIWLEGPTCALHARRETGSCLETVPLICALFSHLWSKHQGKN